MPAYIALLRGINVGGRHALKMATLRTVLEEAGATTVQTYIQSGNAVFTHAARAAGPLAAKLATTITKAAGFPVPVTLRTASELAAIVAANPYPGVAPEKLHVMFCGARPAASTFTPLDASAFAPEAWSIGAREVYLHLPGGMGTSKLAVRVSRLAGLQDATVRNWRTVETLAAMAAER